MIMNGVKKRTIKESNMLNRRSPFEKVVFTVVFWIFLIHTLGLLFPVTYLFITSLKTSDEFLFNNAFSLPEILQWRNYIKAFTVLKVGETNFLGMILNSIWYTGVSTLFSIFFPACTGYVFSRYRFKGRDAIYTFVIATMMIPLVGTTAAGMKFIANIGLYDSPLYVVYARIDGFGAQFLVFYGFFKSISWSYAEAVQIDGGGPFTIFFKIMLPQALPVLLTYAITNGIAYWNKYDDVLMFMPSFPTVASGLFSYKSQVTRTGEFTVYYAGLLISCVPSIVLFAVFSNRIMSSLTMGGLKG